MKRSWSWSKRKTGAVERLKSIPGCSTPEHLSNTANVTLKLAGAALNGDFSSITEVAIGLREKLRVSVYWLLTGKGKKRVLPDSRPTIDFAKGGRDEAFLHTSGHRQDASGFKD